MNWELVAARLTAAFTDVRLETSTGRVLVAKEPVDFRALPQEAAETDEEEIDLDAFVVEEFLASRRPLTPLLDLEWHASHLTLHAFDAGDHRLYLGQPEQDDCIVYGHRMVAALEPRGCPVVCSAFFTDLVRTNGRGYGADLFGSLPETTINHVPHPVPRRVVLDAHWGWMQEVSPDLWLDLFDIVVKEPAPQDVFQVSTQKHGEIRRLAGLGPRQRISARHISGSLAHLRSEVARMPLDLRRWVLETSLERTYREG